MHKPKNYVALAMQKRSGGGTHRKTHKQLRGRWKRSLCD
jgi:hypothetical protein